MAFSPSHSMSQIDGVNFKLGERFHAPQKITLPVGLEFGNPADIWFTEYDFSLEESVVKWADEKKAEERQLEEQKQQLEEQRRLFEEQRLREQAAADAPDDLGDQTQRQAEEKKDVTVDDSTGTEVVLQPQPEVTTEDRSCPAVVTSSNDSAVHTITSSSNYMTAASDANTPLPAMQAVPQSAQSYPHAQGMGSWQTQVSSVGPTPVSNQVTTPASTALPQNAMGGQYVQSSGQQAKSVQNAQNWSFYEGSAILTPEPVAQQPSGTVARQVSDFDYAQFEKEEDPFDQVELKTLNVMDELNKVLQSAQATVRDPQQSHPSSAGSNMQQPAMGGKIINQTNNSNVGLPTNPPVSRIEGAHSVQSYQNSDVQSYNTPVTLGNSTTTGQNSTTSGQEAQVKRPQMGVHISPGINGTVKFSQGRDEKLGQMAVGVSMPNGCVTNIETNIVANRAGLYTVHPGSNSQVTPSEANRPYKSLKEVDYPELDSPCSEPTVEVGKLGVVAFKSGGASSEIPGKPVTQASGYPMTGFASHRPDTGSNNVQQAYHINNIPSIMSYNAHSGLNNHGYNGLPMGANYNSVPGKTMTDFEKLFGTRSFNRTVNDSSNLPSSSNEYSGSRLRSLSRGSSPAPRKPGLRSAKSVPDLTALSDCEKVPDYPASKTPPSSSRSRTPVDFPFLSSYPADDSHPFLQDTWKSSLKGASSKPAKPSKVAPPALPDPYHSLSHEARHLVENITDMGFPRARVARAVQMFGKDDKQVVDYLFLVNSYIEQGHHASDVETAAQLYVGQEHELTQYLKMLATFRELGFADEKIKHALEKHGLDENETLNELVAC